MHVWDTVARQSFALKAIEKHPYAVRAMLPQLYHEVRVHSSVASECQHCVRVHAVAEDQSYLYMVLDLHPRGSLTWALSAAPAVSEAVAAVWMEQAARALYFLHQRGVVHRDVKLDNLLLAMDGSVKLTDFGWCAYLSDAPVDLCGTPAFVAPEVKKGEGQTEKIDSWALGMLLAQLLLGRAPRQPEFPEKASRLARNLLAGLWRPCPQERFSMVDVLDHPFLWQYRQPGGNNREPCLLLRPSPSSPRPSLRQSEALRELDLRTMEKVKQEERERRCADVSLESGGAQSAPKKEILGAARPHPNPRPVLPSPIPIRRVAGSPVERLGLLDKQGLLPKP